ncbi:MAG: hypothetical protein ACC645_10375 [Pirellulales bacterium]
MNWNDVLLEQLAKRPVGGYHQESSAATEPTALACLALAAHGRQCPARDGARWLTDLQAADGSVGIRQGQPTPRWATPLAVMAWQAVDSRQPSAQLADSIRRACRWIFHLRGKAIEDAPLLGHNTHLVAWPWVEGTHSWIEPTALCVLALKVAGCDQQARTREGVAMLVDRLLPTGGCNYGNTSVMGRQLRPHVQPTALALLALVGEKSAADKIPRSLAYLRRHLTPRTTAVSLAWGLQALASHHATPRDAPTWLEQAAERELKQRQPSTHRLALLALAAADSASLWSGIGGMQSERMGSVHRCPVEAGDSSDLMTATVSVHALRAGPPPPQHCRHTPSHP